MKGFLDLIEQARIGITSHEGKSLGAAPESFWGEVERCNPFVFHDIKFGDEHGNPFIHNVRDLNQSIDEIDAPFPVFSIERMPEDILFAVAINSSRGPMVLNVRCLMVVETAPKSYKFFGLTNVSNTERSRNEVVSFAQIQASPMVKKYLDALGAHRSGAETARTSVRVGNGASKRQHRIRRIIHVASKKVIQSDSPVFRDVDWSHRFSVRGHWRTHNGLGKDRDGNYSVHGYTWVVHHTKGPEHLPLINKTRLVKKSPSPEIQGAYSLRQNVKADESLGNSNA